MRSAKFASLCLLLLAVGLAVGNYWTATHRSTIPLSLNGTVTKTEQRFGKHHGKDDVYLIWIDDVEYQVDKDLFEEVAQGDTLQKSAWSKQVLVNGRRVTLGYSKDWSGMLIAMPLVVCVFVATIVFSLQLAATQTTSAVPTMKSEATMKSEPAIDSKAVEANS